MDQQTSFDLQDHLFRESYGKIVAALSFKFGKHYLDSIENVIQESLVAAVKNWPVSGVPKDPEAWLYRVAYNRFIDFLRKERRAKAFRGKTLEFSEREETFDNELLRLIFLTCHPSLKEENQVVLTLNLVCGIGVKELAHILALKEKTVEQRITRAKAKIKKEDILFELPADESLEDRINPVLNCIYALFNHGYLNFEGDRLLSEEICREALRINGLLLRDKKFARAKGHALQALFLFQLSRFKARVGLAGEVILLENQDRSLWDKNLIQQGLLHLKLSTRSEELSRFHVEGSIASIFSISKDDDEIDWQEVAKLYKILIKFIDNPIYKLSHCFAVYKSHGGEKAWELVHLYKLEESLKENFYLHACLAEFSKEIDKVEKAKGHYSESIALCRNEQQKELLIKKQKEL